MEITVGIVIIWLICGIISAFIASMKGRSGIGWFFVGFLLGPIGVIITAVVKRKESKINITINYPETPSKKNDDVDSSALRTNQLNEKEEHLKSLLKQAISLEATDLDTSIRIVNEVIDEYEKMGESYYTVSRVYFKLARYYLKNNEPDKAWGIYNKLISKVAEKDDIQLWGMDFNEIYHHMARMRKKEGSYKDALMLELRSLINRNVALHIQDRVKETSSAQNILELLDKFVGRKIIYRKDVIMKRIKPLVKEWKRKAPVKEPYIVKSMENREKIERRYSELMQLSNKQLKLLAKDLQEIKTG